MGNADAMAVGALAMAYAAAGLFFLRFWWDTRDRLFAFFAVALFTLAVSRVGFTLLEPAGGTGALRYWTRLAAFTLILAAIVDKNRTPGRRLDP